MNIEIKQPEVGMPIQESIEYQFFLQLMANRWIQGHCRYGSPHQRQKYLSRLKREVRAYALSGNQEQLINIANYAFLEWLKPENKKAHFDPFVDSVTRKEFGGAVDKPVRKKKVYQSVQERQD